MLDALDEELWAEDVAADYDDDETRASLTAAIDPLVVEAARALCDPPPRAVFVDPVDGDRFAWHRDECDARGRCLVCVEDSLVQVGTERAALVLDGGTRYFHVTGRLGVFGWLGYIAATSETAVEAYAARLGLWGVECEILELHPYEMELLLV